MARRHTKPNSGQQRRATCEFFNLAPAAGVLVVMRVSLADNDDDNHDDDAAVDYEHDDDADDD